MESTSIRACFGLALWALQITLALGQSAQGIYQPKQGSPVAWRVTSGEGLIWGASSYKPVGLRIKGTPDEVKSAAESKVNDVIVELPVAGAGWDATIAALESRNLRYLIQIESLAPAAEGYVIEPQTYRIGGITSKQVQSIRIPGCQSAVVVLASRRDSSIVNIRNFVAVDGLLTMEFDPPNDLEHVALIYPETTAVGMPDLWEGFDDHRDRLLASLKMHATGSGLRGVVNPLGQLVKRNQDQPFLPKSPRFREEFAKYLEDRYRNVATAMRSWGMGSSELDSFDALARLIPLFSGTRGVGVFYDPVTHKSYTCEFQRSTFWPDLRLVVASEEVRRYQRLVAGIKRVADVPVLQEWRGWVGWYEGASTQLDGITGRMSAETFSQLIDSACRPVSSVARWGKAGWLVASDVEFTPNPSDDKFPVVTSELYSLGYRGIFVRSEDPLVRQAVAKEATQANTSTVSSPTPLFFPENALNPANPQRLPSGRWWLPAPVRGNRVPMGKNFFAYRLEETGNASSVIWTAQPALKVKLRFAQPKTVVLANLDGSDPVLKRHKNAVEVNFGELPILVSGTEEFPVPEPAINEALTRFERLVKQADSLRMDVTEEVLAFRDGSRALEQNPNPGFQRMMDSLRKLNLKLAPFMWLEAENFRDSNFSDVTLASGCSNGSILGLRVNLMGLANDFRTTYTFMPRTGQELEVWVAARIPKEHRQNFAVFISGQMLKISTEPVSLYSNEFGWYRLGTTRLSGASSTVEVRVTPSLGLDIAIDAIVLYPGQFRPDGVNHPDVLDGLL